MARDTSEATRSAQERSTTNETPLHVIQEQEIEISGIVMACRNEAESAVAEARREAARRVAEAEREGEGIAVRREAEVMAEAETAARAESARSEGENARVDRTVDDRREGVIDSILRMVTDTSRGS